MIIGELISSEDVAMDIRIFSILLNENLNYRPGQFIVISFEKDSKERRSYSILSIEKNILKVMIKISGEFTKKLFSCAKGTKLFIYGPYGKFTLKGEKSIFIAGGIGIVPMYAIFMYALSKNNECYMYYSAKTKEDMALHHELSSVNSQHHNVKFYFTSSGKRFSLEDIPEKFFDGTYDFYVCGPERMLTDLTEKLSKKNVKVYTESFVL